MTSEAPGFEADESDRVARIAQVLDVSSAVEGTVLDLLGARKLPEAAEFSRVTVELSPPPVGPQIP